MGIGYQDYNDPALQPPEPPMNLECLGCHYVMHEELLDDDYLCEDCLSEEKKGDFMKTSTPIGIHVDPPMPVWAVKMTWFVIGVASVLFIKVWL